MASDKAQIARIMRTPAEIRAHTPIFRTAAWETQKKRIAKRVQKKQEAAHARAVIRKEVAKPKSQTRKDIRNAKAIVKKVEKKRARNLKYQAKHKK
jgi:hypothetical protein